MRLLNPPTEVWPQAIHSVSGCRSGVLAASASMIEYAVPRSAHPCIPPSRVTELKLLVERRDVLELSAYGSCRRPSATAQK